MSHLIIPQSYLIKNSGISSNTDFNLISPKIVLVQELRLRELLGTNLYNEIITQTTPPTSLTPENEILMNTYIAPFMVSYVQSLAVNATKYRFTNIGVISRDGSGQGANAISDAKAKELTDDYKNDAERYGQLMIDFIRANPGDYTAYFTNTGMGDVKPQKTAYDVQMFLSGKKYRRKNDLDND